MGGGPAAWGLLEAAIRLDLLGEIAAGGVTLLDRATRPGGGTLAGSDLPANSSWSSVCEGLPGPAGGGMAGIGGVGTPVGRPTLADVAACQQLRATLVAAAVRGCGVSLRGIAGAAATSVRPGPDGWRASYELAPAGRPEVVDASKVVLAVGGRSRGVSLPGRTVLSGLAILLGRRALPGPGIGAPLVVLGGGHTAWQVAGLALGMGHRVTLASRHAPVWSMPGVAYGPQDVCPVTGRPLRMSGLRGQAQRLAASGHERLDVVRVASHRDVPEQGVVVDCLAPVSRAPALLDAGHLLAGPDGHLALDGITPLDGAGNPLRGVAVIGLGASPRRSDDLGGEPSYSGRLDSLRLYRAQVGARAARLLADETPLARPH